MFPLTRYDHDVFPMRDGFEGSLIRHGLFVYLDIYYSPRLLHDDVFPLILCHIPKS